MDKIWSILTIPFNLYSKWYSTSCTALHYRVSKVGQTKKVRYSETKHLLILKLWQQRALMSISHEYSTLIYVQFLNIRAQLQGAPKSQLTSVVQTTL